MFPSATEKNMDGILIKSSEIYSAYKSQETGHLTSNSATYFRETIYAVSVQLAVKIGFRCIWRVIIKRFIVPAVVLFSSFSCVCVCVRAHVYVCQKTNAVFAITVSIQDSSNFNQPFTANFKEHPKISHTEEKILAGKLNSYSHRILEIRKIFNII